MTHPDREVSRVITRDRSSGRVHVRLFVNGQPLTDERCNLDDAGAYEVVPDEAIAELDRDALCRRCFPEDAA